MPLIPFNRPHTVGTEFGYISEAIAAMHISGDGRFTQRCSGFLEELLDVPRVLLTTSCTHALEMSALLLDIQPGDEVVLPSFTFVSTANAFVLRGAKPVFADIRPDTLNMDERLLETLLSPRTKAIVPVHYAGIGCEMDEILKTAKKAGVPVVEDNAHGFLGKYRGKYLGTFGALSTLSFHETKNFSCGEGGALLVNDPRYLERAEIIREKGTDRSKFFRGEVDKYTWQDLGSSYLPSDILAAFLFAQFEAKEAIHAQRRRVWEYYHSRLSDWAGRNGVSLPFVPEHCTPSFFMYHLVLPSPESRKALIRHLAEREIQGVFHYLPLHLSPMGRKFGGKEGDCPVTEGVSERLLRLPFFIDLNESDLGRIVEGIVEFSP